MNFLNTAEYCKYLEVSLTKLVREASVMETTWKAHSSLFKTFVMLSNQIASTHSYNLAGQAQWDP